MENIQLLKKKYYTRNFFNSTLHRNAIFFDFDTF